MSNWLWLLALPGLWFLLMFGVCLWEKLKVWPYSDPLPIQPESDPHLGPTSRIFVMKCLSDARQRGFRMVGLTHDTKGPSYKLSYLFQLSADERTLAYIGYGSVMSTEVKGASLVSRIEGDRLLITTTNAALAAFDLSRTIRYRVFSGYSFSRLYESHQEWTRSQSIVPFDGDDTLSDFKAALTQRAERLAKRGLLRWVDTEHSRWSYSIPGAFLFALVGFWANQLRSFFRNGL